MTNPTPKRRRFRFSLRTLLIVVVLLSVPMGWFALKVRQAERQRKAVAAIREVGGVVLYDYQQDEAGVLTLEREGKPPLPAWLTGLLGEDFFFDVLGVDCDYCTQVDDGVFEHVKGLKKLKAIGLSNTQITDAGLEHVKGLPDLIYLNLSDTQVTDAGLKHLRGLAELRGLDLSGTQVTDAGLGHLKGLRKLVWLTLYTPQVTDAGLEKLKGLKGLRYLTLGGTHVTDVGIKELRKALPNCDIDY